MSEDLHRPTRVSVCARQGARHSMEDTHIVNVDLFGDGGSHWLFAVFDGHGGDEVARFLEKRFAEHVRCALNDARDPLQVASNANADIDYCQVLRTAFASTASALRCAAGYRDKTSDDEVHILESDSEDERNARPYGPRRTIKQRHLRDAGSTAVVALVVDGKTLYCANCGDSEAVLASRRALSGRKRAHNSSDDETPEWNVRCLSTLHKADSALERARIEALGGHVTFMFGTWRVQSTLAVARSFGDFTTSAYADDTTIHVVSSEPDVSGPHRLHCDDLLILACDGLWDVASYNEAVQIAETHQKRASESGTDESGPRAASVAHALVQVAISERNSTDNVSVVALEMGTPGSLLPSVCEAPNDESSESDEWSSSDADNEKQSQANAASFDYIL